MRQTGRSRTPLDSQQRALAAQWWRYALRIAHDRWRNRDVDDIADHATDCVIAAVQYFDPGRGGCRSLRSFICWLVKTTPLHANRERMVDRLTRRLAPSDLDSLAADDQRELETRDLYQHCTQHLSLRDRALLRLQSEGYTGYELAEIFSCSHQAVYASRTKALEQARESLRGEAN